MKLFTYNLSIASLVGVGLLNFIFSNCSGKKLPSIYDPIWQEETLSLNSKFCAKLRECSEGEWEKLPPKLQKYASNRISDIECNSLHRKSNVFHLRGADPERIKTVVRSCQTKIQTQDCDAIRTLQFLEEEDCKTMDLIQKGETL